VGVHPDRCTERHGHPKDCRKSAGLSTKVSKVSKVLNRDNSDNTADVTPLTSHR